MYLTHRFPKLHTHFLISPLKSPNKPHKLLLITSTLLSKSKPEPGSTPVPVPASISHFSTLTATATATAHPSQPPQEGLQVSLETLFVPPETDVSSLKNAPLSARILKGSNIVLSKYAGEGVEVVNAEFVKSSVATEDCPSDGKPEFALVGRSNVGKSSLLNSLVRRKKLALTSKKPVLPTFIFYHGISPPTNRACGFLYRPHGNYIRHPTALTAPITATAFFSFTGSSAATSATAALSSLSLNSSSYSPYESGAAASFVFLSQQQPPSSAADRRHRRRSLAGSPHGRHLPRPYPINHPIILGSQFQRRRCSTCIFRPNSFIFLITTASIPTSFSPFFSRRPEPRCCHFFYLGS
ncbi:hypothetical protein BUALT_Bualt10G0111100 [Buddleja alternifolia]|uniref:G domain-containing protein n=1 Tax=Buddleja alternifolia TaxID=168488 RepID=A0AAV6X531_9LAMI|nr:hypothetical protein BUALT_Bualt10G0111100 [Buddleja alternifolia]